MSLKTINIKEIKPDYNQPRKSFDKEKLKESSETFKTQGVIQPIEIDSNKVIVTGELRWRAAKMAGLKTIPCKVLKGLTKEQRLERQLVENFARQGLGINDVRDSIKRYKKFHPGLSLNEISKRTGISFMSIQRLNLVEEKASPQIKKAVEKGELSIRKAAEIVKAPKEMQEEILEEAIEEKKQPFHERIKGRIKEQKQKKELEEKYKKLKEADSQKIKILRASEIVNTYRSELNGFMQEARKAVYQLKSWKGKDYGWFDPKSRTQINSLLNTTKNVLYRMIKEVEDLEKSVR